MEVEETAGAEAFGEEGEGGVGEFFEADEAAFGPGVGVMGDGDEFFFEEGFPREVGVSGRTEADAEIEGAQFEAVFDVVGGEFAEVDGDARVLLEEFGYDLWGEAGFDGLDDAAGDFSPFESAEFLEGLAGDVGFAEDAFGVFPEEVAGVGEGDAAGVAFEERFAQISLELLDLSGEGRLGEVEALGGSVEVFLFGEDAKGAEESEFHKNRECLLI